MPESSITIGVQCAFMASNTPAVIPRFQEVSTMMQLARRSMQAVGKQSIKREAVPARGGCDLLCCPGLERPADASCPAAAAERGAKPRAPPQEGQKPWRWPLDTSPPLVVLPHSAVHSNCLFTCHTYCIAISTLWTADVARAIRVALTMQLLLGKRNNACSSSCRLVQSEPTSC